MKPEILQTIDRTREYEQRLLDDRNEAGRAMPPLTEIDRSSLKAEMDSLKEVMLMREKLDKLPPEFDNIWLKVSRASTAKSLARRTADALGLDKLAFTINARRHFKNYVGQVGGTFNAHGEAQGALSDVETEIRYGRRVEYSRQGRNAKDARISELDIQRLQRVRADIEARPKLDFLMRIKKIKKGAQYKVELDDKIDEVLMRWDDPLSEQPAPVQEALMRIVRDYSMLEGRGGYISMATGQEIYNLLSAREGGAQEASQAMLDYGIRGHKYKGAQGEDRFNYVLFDAGQDAKIIDERNARIDPNNPAWKYLNEPKAWESPADDPAIEHGLANIVLQLAALNQRMTGGRARLKVERGVFPDATGMGLANGNFHLKSHVLRIAVDPMYGMDEATRKKIEANPAAMESIDPISTLGHETIHALHAMKAIDDADWAVLERAAVAGGWLAKYNIEKKYSTLPRTIQIEEAIAHEFATYLKTHEAKPKLKRIFERMADFFRRMFGLLRRQGYSVNARAEGLFYNIASGGYGGRGSGVKPTELDPDDPRSVLPEQSQRAVREAEKGIDRAGAKQKVIDAAMEYFHRWTRAFAQINKSTENAPLLEALRLLKGASAQAAADAGQIFQRIAGGLSDKQLTALNTKLWAEDLMWTHEQGMKIGFFLEDEQEDGRTAKERLLAVILKADAAIAKDPMLAERLKIRDRERERLRIALVDAGVLTPESARNPSYYAHKVLEYAREEGFATGAGGEKVATPRVFRREGSTKDISLNYAQVETQWMTTALHDIAIQKFLNWLADSEYNFRPALAHRARIMNESWATAALRVELERAKYKHIKHEYVQQATRPSELKWAVKKLGAVPSPAEAPLFAEYSKIASRLASNSFALELETKSFLQSPGRAVDGVPPFMWKMMRMLEEGRWFDDHYDESDGMRPMGNDFPVFEVASWAVQPSSPASAPMKQVSAAFLRAASERRKLMREVLVGDRFINTTSTLAIHRALDPDGKFRTWQPDSTDPKRVKLTIRNGKTIDERAYEQLLGMLAQDDQLATDAVREWAAQVKDGRILGAPTKMLILPKEIADTLDKFHARQVESRVSWLIGQINRNVRRWVLFMPKRVVGFNLRNLSGDAEAWIMNQSLNAPKIWAKHLKDAARMMREAKQTGRTTPELADALRFDVLQSSYIQMQVGEPGTEEVIPGGFMRKAKSWIPGVDVFRGIGRVSFSASKWRENVFRLAPYLYLREQFDKAGMETGDREGNIKKLRQVVGYGSTPRWAREGLADNPEVLAARMARDAMGDYSDMTELGEQLDRSILWFWRWRETNTRRVYNNIKNAWMLPWDSYKYDDVEKKRMYRGFAKALGLTTFKLGKPLLKAAYLYTKFPLYAVGMYFAARGAEALLADEDDEERARRAASGIRPHVPVAHDKETDLRYEWRLPGAMYDALQWIGFENAFFAAQDARMGLRPWSDVLWEMAKGPANVLSGNLSAFYKTIGEAITGFRLWPDVFSPRPVGDRAEHVARTLAIDHEYRALLGREDAEAYTRSWWVALTGMSESSAEQEYRGQDYDTMKLAEQEFGLKEIAKLRKDLRNASIKRNWKLVRASIIQLLGMGEGPAKLADALRYLDPAYGKRGDVKAVVQATRAATGTPAIGADVARDFIKYWKLNPITDEERAKILSAQEKWRARKQRHVDAVKARLEASRKAA